MQKDSDSSMIFTPPQLNGLCIKQQSFRQCVGILKWDYVLEKEDDNGKDDKDKDNKDEDDKDKDDDSNDDNEHNTTASNKKRKYNTIMSGGDNMIESDMAK